MSERNLTEADVEAIAEALERRVVDNLFNSMGRGFFGLVKKGLLLIFGGVALYGMSKGIK